MVDSGFEPSKLGTVEYWNTAYEREIDSFESVGDEGEVWFGEDSAEEMKDWIEENIARDSTILDLGCGNGDLVFRLLPMFPLVKGVDYSPQAIELAQTIAVTKNISKDRFFVGDLFEKTGLNEWDVVADKGTLDAISLNCDLQEGRRMHELYPGAVARITKPGGTLLLTSCNWTREELLKLFTTNNLWELMDEIPRPPFKFGGVEGQTITTIAFKKCT